MMTTALGHARSALLALLGVVVATTASLVTVAPAEAATPCSSMTRGVYDRVSAARNLQGLTASKKFAGTLTKRGYSDNRGRPFSVAVASTANKTGLSAVHVLYDPKTADRQYVTSQAEITRLVAAGRRDNGPAFWASTTKASCMIAVYAYTKNGKHRYETLNADRIARRAAGWTELGVAFYAAKPPLDSTFSIAVIPDTQREAQRAGDPRMANRTRWLVENRRRLDLRFVTHVGDVVDWDTKNHEQYIRARSALSILRNDGIPYSLSVGNHDTAAVCAGGAACPGQNARVAVRNTSVFNTYLNGGTANMAGQFHSGKVDNAYHTFTAGRRNWMVLNLELWPRTEVVNWARNVVASHPNHNVIVVTHAYMTGKGGISTSNGGYGAHSPKYLYDRLISRYPNVKMVFSGHVGKARHRVDRGVNGNRIDSFLLCMHDKTTNPLRVVRINTATNTISSSMYAPYTKKSYPNYRLTTKKTTWVK